MGLFRVGGRSFVLFLLKANEKEKIQGGCARQVQVFHQLCKQEREKLQFDENPMKG